MVFHSNLEGDALPNTVDARRTLVNVVVTFSSCLDGLITSVTGTSPPDANWNFIRKHLDCVKIHRELDEI